ncbi:polysaccharide biosynthesis tyrosine autokinase [Acidiphilium sp. C61]|jgi:capsular exopolysaccharide synthesis family protein|uniref:polysaccharide biosynthesis tyrosine autokinase n=1 Tax=Acidiphilium sp. C61 TaxID=1671485 RepID=UPI00157AACD5|nr:polysaccharide biosynthesis tyrosine autokinase [Acidiphilium sp. C61]
MSAAADPQGRARPARAPDDPLDALRAVRRHWRLAALVALGLPLLSLIALWRMTPVYTATGVLLYDPIGFNQKLLRDVVETAPVTDMLMASQVAILKSPQVMRHVLRRIGAGPHPPRAPEPGFPSMLRRWFGPGLASSRLASRPVAPAALDDDLAARFRIEIPASSQLIDVSYTGHDPRRAARAVNAAMAAYLDRERSDRLQVLHRARLWLRRRARATSSRLESLDVAIALERAHSGTERGAGTASLTHEQAGQLTASLAAAQADLAAARARLVALQGSSEAATAAEVAPEIGPMRARAADLAARLRALASTEGPNNPEYRAAARALAALRGQIGAEIGRFVAADRMRAAADAARVASLQSAIARVRGKAAAQAVVAAPLARLEEQREAESSLLRAETEQIGALESRRALTRPSARIITPAMPPLHASGPRGVAILSGAVLLGLCLGLLAALAADSLNGSFRSGGQVREALGLPCMALVPEIARRTRRGLAVPDYARRYPFSAFAEQIRALRTGLWLAQGAPRSLAITAARPGEGKTTLSVSLALSMAASGARILLIDCDIRQPSLDMVFGLGGLPGLTDHLAGRVALEAAIHRPAIEDDDAVPDVMPAGAVPREALALFMSDRLGLLMDELHRRYDLVILDLPPVFALAEAQVLARAAAAVLLCIRWGQTPRRTVTAAMALLAQPGLRIQGAVLTRVDGARHARSGFPDAELYHPRYGGYFRS